MNPLSVLGNLYISWGPIVSFNLQREVKAQRSNSLEGVRLSAMKMVPLAANPALALGPSTELHTLVVNPPTNRVSTQRHTHTAAPLSSTPPLSANARRQLEASFLPHTEAGGSSYTSSCRKGVTLGPGKTRY